MKYKINKFLRYIIGPRSYRSKFLIDTMNTFRRTGRKHTAKLISWRLQRHGLFISSLAQIPKTTVFPHPISIVIGDGVELSDNVRIYQNVTLGGARIGDWENGNYPKIGANTVIFAGAVIVGGIEIGENCIVGANSVVLSNIPSNSVCVGAPARVISSNKKTNSS